MFTPLAFNKESIVTDGLVFYVDAADRSSYVSGSGVWNDLTGNGNNGTLTNGPTFGGENGGSLTFDGSDDYVAVSNNINPSNITLEFFYKTFISSSYEYLISNARDCCGTYNGYELRIVNGTPRFTIWNSTSYAIVGTPITLDQIYHISATYDGTQMKIYQNGALINTSNTTLGIGNPPSYNLYIGGMGYNPSTYNINGNIYLARIYNRALTPSEITQNYNTLKGRFGL